jgi:tRNA threonylcarbamoyladenosine modification (KEOPS) complex  Pcc1 subunit
MKIKIKLFVDKKVRELLDVQRTVKGRSKISYEEDGIIIEADDVTAARAAVNANLLLLKTVEKVNEKWKYLKK